MSLTPPGPPSDPLQPAYPQPNPGQPVWLQTAYPPESYLRPVSPYAIVAIVVACLVTVVMAVLTVSAYSAGHQYADAVRAGRHTIDVFTMFDVLSLLAYPALLTAYVVSCLWLFRARKNAEVMRPMIGHSRSAGWVWGGWVCPIVNFWFPYQIVRDVDGAAGYPQSRRANLGWWCASYLVFLLLLRIAGQLASSSTSVSALEGLGSLMACAFAANLVALVLWIRLILRITREQESARAAAWGSTTG